MWSVMVMGDQDVREVPALLVERGKDGRHFGRIDHRDGLGRGVAQQHRVIVGETGDQSNLGPASKPLMARG
jgi:hypothetical protein